MHSTILDWLLERIGVVIFVLIFVFQIARGLMRSRDEAPAEEAKPDALEEQRRVQEIQRQIQRRIIERRGGSPESESPPLVQPERVPAPRPETTRMPEPFGGPLRRVFEELQRQAQPPPPPPAPRPAPVVMAPVGESRQFELERQTRLADEMRGLQESQMYADRRVARAAAGKVAAAGSETGQRKAARGRLFDDLYDPQSVQRAVVLREVLGPPVGLR